MKALIGSLAIGFGVLASGVQAEVILKVDGKDYTLTELTAHCQSMEEDPVAQIGCFNAVSALLEQQTSAPAAAPTADVASALDALRNVAQYEGAETGLTITGEGCNAHIVYYANYFHISRRNVSSLDLYSAKIDMSKLALNDTAQSDGLMANGAMQPGATVEAFGGDAIGSDAFAFEAKSARISVADYAVTVADQLATSASGGFDFVLVHPAKQQSSAEIWDAFNTYTQACQQ